MDHYYLTSPDKNSRMYNMNDLVERIYTYSMTSELWQTFGLTIDYWEIKGVPEKEISVGKIVFQKIGNFRGHLLIDQKNELVNIVLNKRLVSSYSVAEFSQILFMEIGNYINRHLLGDVFNNPNSFTKQEFVKSIEKLEFDVRLEIIHGYEVGQFPTSIFDTSVKSFEDYMTDPRSQKHRGKYEDYWEANK